MTRQFPPKQRPPGSDMVPVPVPVGVALVPARLENTGLWQPPDLEPKPPRKIEPASIVRDSTGSVDTDALPPDTGLKPDPDTPHDFGDGGNRNGQPDWLNALDSGGRVCRVCGVSERTDKLIRADRKGMKYHYTDAYGIQMTSMVPLSCPTFLGDVPGAVGEAKQRVRKLDNQMTGVLDRLAKVEAQNRELREQLESKIELDVTNLVQWLGQMVKLHAEHQLPTATVQVAGLPYEIPKPIAEMVKGVAIEAVLVPNDTDKDPTE